MFVARAYKHRLGLVEALLLMPQDLAVAGLLGIVHRLILRCRCLTDGTVRPMTELVVGLALFVPVLWVSLLGLTITGTIRVPLSAELLLQTPSLMFLRTALNTDSVSTSLFKFCGMALLGPVVAGLGAWLLGRTVRGLAVPRLRWWALCPVALLVLISPWLWHDREYRDTNAVVTLTCSAIGLVLEPRPADPGLSPHQFNDKVATLSVDPLVEPPEGLARLRFAGERYDVLIVILETGPARIMELDRDNPNWLPHLRAIARRAIHGRRHLTPYPSSTKSIFAIVSGRYPFPDFRCLIRSWPAAPFNTFVSVLADEGYRTGCYASIDGDFQRMDEFMAAHGFQDQGDRQSLRLTPLADPTFGSDEEMFQRYREWIEAGGGRPSLFVLLPSNSHWPFFFPERDRAFPEDRMLVRHKNALQHQDRLIGDHLGWLERTGRLDRTILVVVPDHGIYFDLAETGEKDRAALMSVHVPLLIDHPLLRKTGGVPVDAPTSHVDIAPTLLDMCSGTKAPPDFQGLSLLRAWPSRRLVFYSEDYGDGQVTATDGQALVTWNRRAGAATGFAWDRERGAVRIPGAPEAAVVRRIEIFFRYQTSHLWSLTHGG
jgi:hypothetical protein